MLPIFVVNGSPAVGKSTLCRALMASFDLGLHVEVDVLREFVVQGIAHPLDWNEETTRQFRLAEEGAADLAVRYQDAGFAVAIDHCRTLDAWDEVLEARLVGRKVVKVVLHCDLEENLDRNQSRTNKDFAPAVLEAIIRDLAIRLPASSRNRRGWHEVANPRGQIASAVEAVLGLA